MRERNGWSDVQDEILSLRGGGEWLKAPLDEVDQEILEDVFHLSMAAVQGASANGLYVSLLSCSIVEKLVSRERQKPFSEDLLFKEDDLLSRAYSFFKTFACAFDLRTAVYYFPKRGSFFFQLACLALNSLEKRSGSPSIEREIASKILLKPEAQEVLAEYERFRSTYVHFFHLLELERSFAEGRIAQELVGDLFNPYLCLLAEKAFGKEDCSAFEQVVEESLRRLAYLHSFPSEDELVKDLEKRMILKDSLLRESRFLPDDFFAKVETIPSPKRDALSIPIGPKEQEKIFRKAWPSLPFPNLQRGANASLREIREILAYVLEAHLLSAKERLPESKHEDFRIEGRRLIRKLRKEPFLR